MDRHDTRKLVSVNVLGDLISEQDEGFKVWIAPKHSDSHHLVITSPTAHGVILNDDFNADLSISKNDRAEWAVPGTALTYTVVVSNSGPTDVSNATVTDVFPTALNHVRYTSQVTQGSASGNTSDTSGTAERIKDRVFLSAGSQITYTITGTIDPAARGELRNTATVEAPAWICDTNPANNESTDVTRLRPEVDLQITKTDNRSGAVPGLTQLTYTIVVTNAGPSAAHDVLITDDFPEALTNVRYTTTSTGPVWDVDAEGSGTIHDYVNMGPGATITYTVTAGIWPWASGTLLNTAEVHAPDGVVDIDPSNNTATDRTQVKPHVDLRITKTDNRESAVPGPHAAHLHDRRDQRGAERSGSSLDHGSTARRAAERGLHEHRGRLRDRQHGQRHRATSTIWSRWLQGPRSPTP